MLNNRNTRIAEQNALIKELAEALEKRLAECDGCDGTRLETLSFGGLPAHECPFCKDEFALIARATKESG